MLSAKADSSDFIICNNKYELNDKSMAGRLRKVVAGNLRQYILSDKGQSTPPAVEPRKALLHIVSGPTHTHAFRNASLAPADAEDRSPNHSGDGVDVLELSETKA